MKAQETMSCGTEFTQATLINATGARLQALQEELQPITTDNIIHDFSTQPRYVFNVYFHKVVADDGTTPDVFMSGFASTDGIGDGDLIVEETYLEAIRALNIKYNRFNIFFKYRGFDIIKNSNFLIIDSYEGVNNKWQQLKEWARSTNNPDTNEPYYNPNGLNLYIVHKIAFASGIGDIIGNESLYAYSVFQPFPSISTVDNISTVEIPPYDIINIIVPHEIGHNLNIMHTDGGHLNVYNNGATIIDNTEHVTRDITNQYYNATLKGDLISDTRADTPKIFSPYVDLVNCSCNNAAIATDNLRDYSTGWIYDANTNQYNGTGELYTDAPVFNIMRGSSIFINRTVEGQSSHCNYARQFTDGQGTRMHETLANNPSIFNPLLTAEESLYEPYKIVGTYGGSGTGDTTLMLESRLSFQAPYWTGNIGYFQPGFDYEVYNCSSCTQTTTGLFTTYGKYDSAADCSHYLPGHAVKIPELGDTTGECAPFPMVHAIGGSVYSHNSATYTAQPLDSLNINSPDLLLNLPDGVHTIKVTTDAGNVLEKTVQITH